MSVTTILLSDISHIVSYSGPTQEIPDPVFDEDETTDEPPRDYNVPVPSALEILRTINYEDIAEDEDKENGEPREWAESQEAEDGPEGPDTLDEADR